MLSISQLLSGLNQLGAGLHQQEGRLAVQMPPGMSAADLDPALRDALAQHRNALIALLRERPTAVTAVPPAAADAAARFEPFPLTEVQHAYWIGRRALVESGGVSTHLYLELDCSGLDLARLNAALLRLIARHDMLRAVIRPDGMQQVLREVPDYHIAVDELQAADAGAFDAAAEHTRDRMSHQVLPAERWPLFEFHATRGPAGALRLHCSLDMLILDAWSMFNLFGEWRRAYDDDAACTAADIGFQYRDYVLAEQALVQTPLYQRAESYWLDRLDALPNAPALPLAARPEPHAPSRFSRRRGGLRAADWAVLKQRGQAEGLTPSALLAAAFAEVLRLWADEPDFTLNLTLYNRLPFHADVARVVGDFTTVNLLEVRDEPTSFAARARRIQRQLAQDLEHLHYNGVRALRERARRQRGGLHAAMPIVFTSALVLSAQGHDASALQALGRYVEGVSQTPQVWLDHQVAEQQDALVYNWDVADAMFPPGLIDDLFSCYGELLRRLLADPAAWHAHERPAQPPAWQAALIAAENDTGSSGSATNALLQQPIAAWAAAAPDAPAIHDATGCTTRGQLHRHAQRLAQLLRHHGAAPNTLVAVAMDKGWEQVAAVLGILHAGAAYLPIDPALPQQRRWQMLQLGQAPVVLTQEHLRDLPWPEGTRVLTLQDAGMPEPAVPAPAIPAPAVPAPAVPAPAVPAPAVAAPGASATASDLAYVLFTSGTTGEPKGVMVEHRAAANTVRAVNQRLWIGEHDRVLALSALGFDLSVWDIFGVLGAGGALVMPPAQALHQPATWTTLIEQHGVTLWNSVPQLLQLWLEHAEVHASSAGRSLRKVLLSGDRIPAALPQRLVALCPSARVTSLGGPTEAAIWQAVHPIDDPAATARLDRIPYGRPLANQRLHVRDAQLQARPVWAVGEICIAGDSLARGYWRDEALTASRFVTDPATGERLYRSGDLARRLPGGELDILGRSDGQVKLNGHRLELDEVAAHLRRHPAVADCTVRLDSHPLSGQRQLVAYVVPHDTASAPPAAPAAPEPAWRLLVAKGDAALADARHQQRKALDRFTAVWRRLEQAMPWVMARTLLGLGAFAGPGAEESAASLVARRGVPAVHEAVLAHWLSCLAQAGLLEATAVPGTWRAAATLRPAAVAARANEELAQLPDARGEPWQALLGYFREHAAHQQAVLAGTHNPLQLLFPGGDWQVADALYRHNPVNRILNDAAAAVLRAFVKGRPADAPLQVLEVGAGTGGTTAALLPVLPGGRTRYRCTDVSPFFHERARQRFAEHGFVEYGVHDIDIPAAAQGLPLHAMDVVVAANVLHDARDVDAAMAQLRRLLKPGGLLLLVEATQPSAVQLGTVALLESFGQAQDRRRAGGDALMSPAQWRDCAHDAGFARFAALPEGDEFNALPQHLMVAQAPPGIGDSAALDHALRASLPAHMVPSHWVWLDQMPLSRNGKVDPRALPPPWAGAVPDGTAAHAVIAPRNEVEATLVALWREALGGGEISVQDRFFAVGGDSLNAVRIVARVQQRFPLGDTAHEALLRQLLADTTLEAQAQQVATLLATGHGTVEVHVV